MVELTDDSIKMTYALILAEAYLQVGLAENFNRAFDMAFEILPSIKNDVIYNIVLGIA